MASSVLTPFVEAARSALENMTGAMVGEPLHARVRLQSVGEPVGALVAIVGRVSGLIAATMERDTAHRLAASLRDGPPEELTASVAGELANLVAAGGASRLADEGVEATVTVPQVIAARATFVSRPVLFDRFQFQTSAGLVHVLLSIAGPAARAARPDALPIESGPLAVLRVLHRKLVAVHLQPIVSLKTGEVAGYEGLLRGPAGTEVERPDRFFRAAEDAGVLQVLERLARRAALDAKRRLIPPGAKLFLNVDARVPIMDRWCPLSTALRRGFHPSQIVLEVTERTVLNRSPDFLEALRRFRAAGGLVALDDLGAGYSGLKALLAVQPDYIKLDMELVRGIDRNPWQQALAAGLVHFSRQAGVTVVAEGVESRAELEVLRRLGVDLAQGYLIARPAAEPPPVAAVL